MLGCNNPTGLAGRGGGGYFLRMKIPTPLVLIFSLVAASMVSEGRCGEDDQPQRVTIPHRMPEGGRIPGFRVLIDGSEAGRIRGDAVLSNGRFFGIRWIAEGTPGRKIEIREGEPNTLQVWGGGVVQLAAE